MFKKYFLFYFRFFRINVNRVVWCCMWIVGNQIKFLNTIWGRATRLINVVDDLNLQHTCTNYARSTENNIRNWNVSELRHSYAMLLVVVSSCTKELILVDFLRSYRSNSTCTCDGALMLPSDILQGGICQILKLCLCWLKSI